MGKKLLIVGLGNYAPHYETTRHNIGSMFLQHWVQKNGLVWQERKNYILAEHSIPSGTLLLVRLKTFMNSSGEILHQVRNELKISPEDILLCADNADLILGKSKLRSDLPNNQHKGITNIKMQFPRAQILTLLLGIGRKLPLKKWVLSTFSPMEKKQLKQQFDSLQKTLLTAVATLFASSRAKFITLFHQYQLPLLRSFSSQALTVIGGQWGDEGKGKIVDFLADDNYPLICRFSGGNNAGHTIRVKDQTYKFSALPVGAIRAGKTLIIGSGCVINLEVLLQEWTEAQRIHSDLTLKISSKAHLIMPYHLQQDDLEEQQRSVKIGTTKQGIGPCLQDKVGRYGFQIGELQAPRRFIAKLTEVIRHKNIIWTQVYRQPPLQVETIASFLLEKFSAIKSCLTDMQTFWTENANRNVLFEGAQGTLLDLDFGFYPFVTSTSTTSNAIALGLNQPFFHNRLNFGVFKAYVSRVGAGPLPTLMHPEIAAKITGLGHEEGVVTQRLRKIGWFDAVLGRYAVRLNDFRQIALTCLDALTGIAELKIAVAYKINGQTSKSPLFFPSDQTETSIEYITLPGWTESLRHLRHFDDLPTNAQTYIHKISELLKTKIKLISVGPEREATIVVP